MGCYDSINIEIECPSCGISNTMECQTKELYCALESWSIGDRIPSDQFKYLNCITSCPRCQTFFNVKVFLQHNVVTGGYEIIKK